MTVHTKKTTERTAYVQHRWIGRRISLQDLRDLVETTKDYSKDSIVDLISSNNISVTEVQSGGWQKDRLMAYPREAGDE